MAHRLLYIAVVALVIAAAAPARAATDKGLPAAGTALTLTPTRAGYEASVDVAAEEAYEDVRVGTTDTRLVGRVSTEVTRALLAPAGIKRVLVRVKGGDLRQGPYAITLLAARTGPKGSVERDVSLVVPAATLDPPATLVIRRVCDGLIVRGDCYGVALRVDADQPQLWETTQQQWLTGIALVQKGNTDADGEAAGILHVLKAPADAVPGAPPRIEYGTHVRLRGPFPLGTAKGKLVVRADQLAAPVALDFEVRSRTTRFVLIVVLALGLALGWVTRRFLGERRERLQEQQKTYALMQLVDATLARTADADVRAALMDVRTQAEKALAAKSTEDTKNGTAAAQKAFFDQQEAIRARRAALDQSYGDTLAVLRARWKVPGEVADAVAHATDGVEGLMAERAKNDFARESAALDAVVMEAWDVAEQHGLQCVRSAATALRVASVLAPLFDAAGTETLKELGTPPAAPGRVAPSDPFKAHLDALRKALEHVHAAGAWIDEACATVRAVLLAHVAAWTTRLSNADLLQQAAWADWLQAARHLAARLDPEGCSGDEALVEEASALVKRLGDVLRAQVAQSDRAALDALLAKGACDEAITNVARLRQPVPPAGPRTGALEGRAGAAEGTVIAPTPFVPVAAMQVVPRAPQALPQVAYGVAATTASDTTSISVLAAASQRHLAGTTVLLQLTYAAIIVVGGYFLLGPKWVGTPLDMAIAFFWAYATDIGADAATAAVRGLKA